VDRDILRKSLVLTATLNEIEPLMRDPAVTSEAVERYAQENEELLQARADEYWGVLWND
jgi:hypothetical protein